MTTAAHPADGSIDAARSRVDELLAGGRAAQAAELARDLTRRRPDDEWAWQRLAAALLAGDGGKAADREAREAAERCVTLDPTSAIGYRMLSEAALRLGDRDAALSTMRAAVQAAPDSWVAHLDLAAALIDRPGGAQEAARIARRAARLAPHRPEPHLVLGEIAQHAGDLSAAAASFADALDADPDNARAKIKLAELHARLEPPPPVPDRRPARVLGDGLASLNGLAFLVAAMLAALAPDHDETWFRTVVLVGAGGLILVTAAVGTSARRLFAALPVGRTEPVPVERRPPVRPAAPFPGWEGDPEAAPAHAAQRRGAHRAVIGPGYLTGLAVSTACLLAAALTILGAGLTGSTTALRAALCVGLAGYGFGHLLARFADKAAMPEPDDRPAGRMRSGAFFALALGCLVHAVVFIALALLDMVLPRGAGQVVTVAVVTALIFVAGMQYAALTGLAAVHRVRFGSRPYPVLTGVTVAAAVDAVGVAGALTVLFTEPVTALLLTGAFLSLAVATVSALVAATLRR